MQTFREKKPNREKPIFYGSKTPGITPIAQINRENGEKFQLITTGEIRIKYKGTTYSNTGHRKIETLKEKTDLNDKKIEELEQNGELEWLNNSWFEILYTNKEMDGYESIGNISHTYSHGIAKLKQQAEELPTQQKVKQ